MKNSTLDTVSRLLRKLCTQVAALLRSDGIGIASRPSGSDVLATITESRKALARGRGKPRRFSVADRRKMAAAKGTLKEVAVSFGCHWRTVGNARREFGTNRK